MLAEMERQTAATGLPVSKVVGRPLFEMCEEVRVLDRGLPRGVHIVRFAEGETLFSPNEQATSCYRLIAGRVDIRPDSPGELSRTIETTCEPGEIFGEMAALSGTRRASQAVAAEPVVCMLYSMRAFVRLVESDRQEALAYAETIIARQRRASRQLVSGRSLATNEDGTALSLQGALGLFFAIEELLERLEQDQEAAISFARTLARSLVASGGAGDLVLDRVA